MMEQVVDPDPWNFDFASFYETPLIVSMVKGEEELKSLNATIKEYSVRALKMQEREINPKAKTLFYDDGNNLSQISEIIDIKIYGFNRWRDCEAVVCKDLEQRIQAVGLLMPNRDRITESFESSSKHSKLSPLTTISTEVYLLATAYWNIPSKQTQLFAHKVRGAGTSIIYYASELSKTYGSRGEVFLTYLPSSEAFYKEKLGFIECYTENKFSNEGLLLTAEKASWLPFKFASITCELPA